MVLVQVATCYFIFLFVGALIAIACEEIWNFQMCNGVGLWVIGVLNLQMGYWTCLSHPFSKSDHMNSSPQPFVCPKTPTAPRRSSGCLVTMASDTAGSFEVEAPVAAPRRTRKRLGPSLVFILKSGGTIAGNPANHLVCQKNLVNQCKSWSEETNYPSSTGAGFLNHQQYDLEAYFVHLLFVVLRPARLSNEHLERYISHLWKAQRKTTCQYTDDGNPVPVGGWALIFQYLHGLIEDCSQQKCHNLLGGSPHLVST